MNPRIIFLLITCSALLSACSGDVKSSLGLKKEAPDEFVVISNPPLREPPEFSLTAPTNDLPERGIIIQDSAKQLNNDDVMFLEYLEEPKHSNVKNAIDSEHYGHKKEHESKNSISRAISKIRGENEDPVIDPEKEKARLNENAASGKPINEGVVKNKSNSTLNKILD
ncbi:MAG: hypothetical protein K0R73_361 [Candidatus Midichloriaceae bacterium]|jgi:hypothetical protein|nr:hypothetical protein [Candidatus Midichloriaceae bacterium]